MYLLKEFYFSISFELPHPHCAFAVPTKSIGWLHNAVAGGSISSQSDPSMSWLLKLKNKVECFFRLFLLLPLHIKN